MKAGRYQPVLLLFSAGGPCRGPRRFVLHLCGEFSSFALIDIIFPEEGVKLNPCENACF